MFFLGGGGGGGGGGFRSLDEGFLQRCARVLVRHRRALKYEGLGVGLGCLDSVRFFFFFGGGGGGRVGAVDFQNTGSPEEFSPTGP